MLHQLLATLRDLNIRLFVEDGTLKCIAPPGSLTNELAQQIKAQKTELMTVINSSTNQSPSMILPGMRSNPVRLSFSQQRLWFLDQLEPGSSFYNIPIALRLTGHLDLTALTQSFNEIVRRHEVLRTVFEMGDAGEPVQKILPSLIINIEQIDLTATNQTIVWQAFCRDEAAKPFDLYKGPLVRASLLMLADSSGYQDAVLMLTMHHIVSDGWSLTILVKEFAALYSAFVQNQPSQLPELPIQYADFACWQRRWLVGDELERQLNYWREQLGNTSSFLELPTDYPRPAVMTYRGATQCFDIAPDLAQQIRVSSKQHNVTLFILLLAVFKLLLSRYSGQSDICVGTPVANRNRQDIENLIGFFVNTLVLRSDLSANPNFAELLAQVKFMVLDAQNHQDLPFEKLVEALQPERDPSRTPLFQVMFVLQNHDKLSLSLPGVDVAVIEDTSQTAKFDLTLHIQDWPDGQLSGAVEYNTDLFEAETIKRFTQHYLIVLQAAIKQPQVRVSELPLLSHMEKRQILHDWNDTDVEYPQDRCIHQLFEAQVEQAPDAIALSFEGKHLTYAELNAKANQVAHYLIERGVGPDVLVGICLERSLEMVIGLLGILKAGGAYVPLDPNYPGERIRYMLDDAGVEILLIRSGLAGLVDCERRRTVNLDNDWPAISLCSETNCKSYSHPLDLAYIIYTSGSTGLPKGVMVNHRNAVHSTLARFNQYPDQVKAYLLLSSFAFDSSVAGIFWTFGQGGCLCLPGSDAGKDPSALANLIEQQQVSHLLALPSLYGLLLDQASEQLRSLKVSIVAGEACASEVVKRHFAVAPTVKLYNEYGPTEGTVWSSVYQASLTDRDKLLSIGRPINNVRLYILDRYLNPVPVGVAGELYIGGAGIVRGYLQRFELTSERFIPNPFCDDSSRLYKTGDLARYRADGAIEFLGRIDHQVKIRGFRIELGEIEAQLLTHPGIKEAVVLAREDQPGDKRLVAYLVEDQHGTLQLDGLKVELKQALPDYMVPSAFMILDQMPLGANGKMDRKQLSSPNISEQLIRQYVAPRTETEQILVGIWQEILCVEQIGVEDDFFELGGHSLLATQLAFAVEKKLQVKFPVKVVFEKPNIAQQAGLLNGESEEEVVNLQEEAQLGRDILPLVANPTELAQSNALLLTGATGFLGAFLLVDLLEQTKANVYCLIRAADESQAMNRLQRQLERYELIGRIDWSRVIPVCGDLAVEHLGLNQDRYREIVADVDAIFHNGALVNFVQSYQGLKAANVLSCIEVLRLAATVRPKAIHYVSTLSVFAGRAKKQRGFSEADEPELNEALTGGYEQSKWVAEKVLRSAQKRGFQITVYRPATVAGDSQNGVWNTDDFMCRVFKGCVQMGLVPDVDKRLDMAPVDYISSSIVQLALTSSVDGKIFHLNHPHPPTADALFGWFISAGIPLRKVTNEEWLESLKTATKVIPDFALAPLMSMFSGAPEIDNLSVENKAESYDCMATQQYLASQGIVWGGISDTLLERHLNYFYRCGFLKGRIQK